MRKLKQMTYSIEDTCMLQAYLDIIKRDVLDVLPNSPTVKLRASDLRMRLEFGGCLDDLELPAIWGDNHRITCRSGNIAIQTAVSCCIFDDFDIKYETGQNGGIAYIDVILYSGEEISICFNDISNAVCTLAISMQIKGCERAITIPAIEINEKENRIKAEWLTLGGKMTLEADTKPYQMDDILDSSIGTVNGVPADRDDHV